MQTLFAWYICFANSICFRFAQTRYNKKLCRDFYWYKKTDFWRNLSFCWLGWQDSNLRNATVKVWCLTNLATSQYMGWTMGLEPTTTRTTIWRSTNWTTSTIWTLIILHYKKILVNTFSNIFAKVQKKATLHTM